MLQFKIPQNVQREDQIVSFLTMRQLLVLAVGGGVCYFLFMLFAKFYLLGVIDIVAIIIFPAVLTLCIAFLNIQGVSFTKWVLLVVEYNLNPQKRIWNNKYLVENEINAVIISAQSQTKSKSKKEDNIADNTPHKSLAELVEEININRAQYKKKNHLPVGKNFAVFDFDEEDLQRIQNLNSLSNQTSATSSPNHQNLILNETVSKIKTVRPNLTTPQENVQNILNANNYKLNLGNKL